MSSANYKLLFSIVLVFSGCICTAAQQYIGDCDKDRNANLPFCDSSLPIDTRVEDLIARLTVSEKIALLVHNSTGAGENVELEWYNWWNEALKGVAYAQGTNFRPPTDFVTVFPQPINLASAFDRQLFSNIATAAGNEARAMYNVGNSGLTYWSPNINIYRDPRWGRGHETPGEDPYLSSEYARVFVRGLQDPHNGFLKNSACCKHFAAHSVEENRLSFNSVVTEQDMADTYLPAFKSCVQEADVSCIMCAYSAINGIPSCGHKGYLTHTLREQWGFQGYVVTDCGAVQELHNLHHYAHNATDACRIVLDAGVDIECHGNAYFTRFLADALAEGVVSEEMMDTALFRAYKVLMRLGHFEKDLTRPFKDLVPSMVDSDPHKQLALEAARRSIVLLKNAPNARTGRALLPLDAAPFRAKRATMGAIGPFVFPRHGYTYLANYHGLPSARSMPLDGIRKFVPDLEWAHGCDVVGNNDTLLQEAQDLARNSEQVVLFVGITSQDVEAEARDRHNLTLPGLQDELVHRVLAAAQQPVILFVVSGGALDIAHLQNDPRVGAIIWAGYIGQAAGDAMADVMFGTYNPSGRLAQTFYTNDFIEQADMTDMRMRPNASTGNPGRTYRFFTGQPLYPFGYGLSYTTFDYQFIGWSGECMDISVRNSGDRVGDHSVLWFLAPPNAGEDGRPIKSLVQFEKLENVQPLESRIVRQCLGRDRYMLADEQGEFHVVPGEWTLTVGTVQRLVTVYP